MALRTWQITLKDVDKTINVKAAKADVEKLSREIRNFLEVNQWTRNLCGTIGGYEYESLSTMLFLGKDEYEPLADPGAFELDKLLYFAELPPMVTDVEAEITKVKALFNKHVRVNDERKTVAQEEIQKQNSQALHKEMEEKDRQRTKDWLDSIGASGEKVKIPEGMLAITAQYTYDGSDPMSDYFHSHAHIGETLLLAIVPKQAETERLARSIVARYPDLAEHKFEWHTEKWSMGHGNYLTSEYFGTAEIWSKQEVATRVEIEFGSGRTRELYPYPGYPGKGASITSEPAADAATGNGSATMNLNGDMNGVEVKFTGKPDESTISTLKSGGFRFSRRQCLWYAKQSPRTIALAEKITASA